MKILLNQEDQWSEMSYYQIYIYNNINTQLCQEYEPEVWEADE